ncbi:MAG TPA: S41 family peptidase [Kofleriaceae bacterium]|nr:S41 family peptidase [Kofleriaceae bacterium]
MTHGRAVDAKPQDAPCGGRVSCYASAGRGLGRRSLFLTGLAAAALGCAGKPGPPALAAAPGPAPAAAAPPAPAATPLTPIAPAAFDPSPWRADYLELRDALSTGYANLEWALVHRGLDPYALDQRTLAAIDAARSDVDGLWALTELVAAFADPHLRIDPKDHPVYGAAPRYPLRLARRGAAIAITEIDTPGCALRAGDEVTALDGKPIAEEQRRYRRLVNSTDEAWALDRALRLAVSSPFAPGGERLVEGRRDGAALSCRIHPVTAAGAGAGPAGPAAPPRQQPPASAEERAAPAWRISGAEACRALGFERGTFAFPYPLPAGALRVELGAGEFPAAVVTTPAGARIGLLRIASFQDHLFLDACAATWERLRPRQRAERCERACQEDFTGRAVRQEIGARFAAVLDALTARGVTALALDITGNGGGNSWVDDVARMLSDREPGCGKHAVIRHPHWSRRYAEELGALEQVLARGGLSAADRALVVRGAEHTRRMLAATKESCDLRPLWTQPGYRAGCSLLAPADGALCGREAERLDALTDPAGPPALVWDRVAPRAGLYRGPLFVLVNSGTASASEQLLSRLQMASRGVLLGQRTLGAGCGYTNGGLDVVLTRSRLRVRLPDCVRYLASGDNEVAGIAPSITLAATDAASPAFLAEALTAIERALGSRSK